MRFIKFLSVFVLLTVSKFAIAQIVNLETVTYSYVPQQNGTILLNYNQPTTMRARFTVSRILSATSSTWPNLPIKAQISLYVLSPLVPNSLIDVIDVSTSDWYGPTYTISKLIEKDIVIPAGAVTLAYPNTTILARFRFYKEGYPSPYNTDGWTDWVDAKYTSMSLNQGQIPQTSFNGPNSVCDEGIYTITNPYTVSLENATGIATLTALGNNQWKVTRQGTATRTIILRSNFNGHNFDKEIIIGGGLVTGIQGPDNVNGGHSYVLNALTEGAGTVEWQYNSPYINSVGYSGNVFEFYTSEILQNQKNIKIPITFKFTSTCGTITSMTKTLTDGKCSRE
jgi:hypothetical protein